MSQPACEEDSARSVIAFFIIFSQDRVIWRCQSASKNRSNQPHLAQHSSHSRPLARFPAFPSASLRFLPTYPLYLPPEKEQIFILKLLLEDFMIFSTSTRWLFLIANMRGTPFNYLKLRFEFFGPGLCCFITQHSL